MRYARAAAATGGCLLLALAGCGDGDTGPGADDGTATSTPAGSPSAGSGGPAPTCVLGDWRSTSARAAGEAAGATAQLRGGDGVRLHIERDGRTRADFTGSQPLTFTAAALGADVKGQFSYTGTAEGTVRFPGGDARSGPWEPTGQLDWGGLKVTVKLTDPVAVTVLDNASLSELTGDRLAQAGNAVDPQPIFRTGTYSCEQETLTIAPRDSGPTVTWVFTRA